MDNILNFENRAQLFEFLIYDFGMKKEDERYDSDNFGNFFITLSSPILFLRYTNDRGFLTIQISSKLEPHKWYDLSYVRDLIQNNAEINSEEQDISNSKRIQELNNFLKNQFAQISLLFSEQEYYTTKKNLDELLTRQFKRNFPE